jgi:LmbE family N-acetylglucosaminyl deacetylase
VTPLLAVGAHPDDIEIGAAALIAKARAARFTPWFLILTDDPDGHEQRREEARKSARLLGVRPERVLFAGLPDGRLRADRESVARVRRLLHAGLKPALVITHTEADSHNDHAEANRLARAAFRGCAFLCFSVHVSAERQFRPGVFVEVAGERLAAKSLALAAHQSQRSRLERRDLIAYEEQLGSTVGMERAEAFEIVTQEGTDPDVVARALALSESSAASWLSGLRKVREGLDEMSAAFPSLTERERLAAASVLTSGAPPGGVWA